MSTKRPKNNNNNNDNKPISKKFKVNNFNTNQLKFLHEHGILPEKIKKENEIKKYLLSNLENKVKNKNINFELGGYYYITQDHKLCFVDDGIPGENATNGRKCILLKPSMLNWHTHPINVGWWPSYEDLMLSTKHPQLLITKYGIWVYSLLKPLKLNHNKNMIKLIYTDFNDALSFLNKNTKMNNIIKDWTKLSYIVDKYINKFILYFHHNGLNLQFLPYYNNQHKDAILQNIIDSYYEKSKVNKIFQKEKWYKDH